MNELAAVSVLLEAGCDSFVLSSPLAATEGVKPSMPFLGLKKIRSKSL